ncbi:MAG: CHC2 zinc finger domain-containing protein [Bacillota bacterium]
MDILEAAGAVGLDLRPSGSEWRACCPFCGDAKFHLYLNPQKNAWHCFRCGEGGGVRDLLVKMGRDPGERPRVPHPVFRLTGEQLRAAGFRGPVGWKALFERRPGYARACADWVWREWCEYDRRRAQALVALLRSLEARKEGGEDRGGRLQSRGARRSPGPRPRAEDFAERDSGRDVLAGC